MKPAPNTLVRESTLDASPDNVIEFGIGDPRWVMQTQAELYSDVTTAIIREYSTNAYDANVMAGHRDPIEVTLPSLLDPFFRVKDTGVGMNREIFKTVYTQFGISDKRGDNTTNGKLGYGSKSGVAYTNQFTVSSVRDGVKTEAVVERMPDWSIVMTIIHEAPTSESNGTEIVFPVHNVEEFRHKAMEFFKYWLPGRVLIDGKAHSHYVGEKITDNFYYSKDWNTSYVVMGNVAYRIANPDALFYSSKMNRVNFVAYVDDINMVDGAEPVEHVPSREDLKYTDRTKKTLQAIIHQFEKDMTDKAQAEVNGAKSHAEAYTAWAKWRGVMGGQMFGDLSFKGDRFSTEFPVLGKRYSVVRYNNSTIAINKWPVENVDSTVFVTDFDVEVSSSVKKRAVEWAELKGIADDVKYFVFTKATSFDSVWVDWTKATVVTWADLKAALPKKDPKARVGIPGINRIAGSWDYTTALGTVKEKEIPADKDVYHISVHQNKMYNVQRILTLMGSDAVVLIVPANRLEKLVRENPRVKAFTQWASSQVVKDGPSLLSDDAKKVFAIDDYRKEWINRLDMSRVNDSDLLDAHRLLTDRKTLLAEYDKHRSLANYLHMGYNGFKEYSAESDVNSFYNRYPLLRSVSRYGKVDEHVYLYMDAVLAAETENNNV